MYIVKDELFLPQEAPVPVLFTATDDDATTRANEERMTSPQMVAQAGGFGVFTYYSNGNGATDGAYGSPAIGGNWKVIPGDDQEFFVRITFKDANGDMKVIPEMPFKEDFEAGKNKIIQITIP